MTAEELGPLVTAGVNQQLEVANLFLLSFVFLFRLYVKLISF